jgi:FtsH-binding integral membrane protein
VIKERAMSYGYDPSVPAAYAEASERTSFIRRTYAHLGGAVLAFVALEAFLLSLPGIENFLAAMFFAGRWSAFVILGAFMLVAWVANSWARSNTSPAMQYLGLGLYVAAEAVLFLPLLYLAANLPVFQGKHVIETAGIMTLTIFVGLTIGVFVTGKDFSFLGPILLIASFGALGLILCGAIFGFNLGIVFSFAMVAVASGYILYDTSNVLYHYRTDQHVAAALALFASVALLFWYILRIVMQYSSRN